MRTSTGPLNEPLSNDSYNQLNEDGSVAADAKCSSRGSLILKVVFGILVLGAIIAIAVHFGTKSGTSDDKPDALNGFPITHLYQGVPLNDNAPLQIGTYHICDWELVDYESLDEVEVVDDHARSLNPTDPNESEDPANWWERNDWHIHNDPEYLLYGKICNDADSDVTLIVETGVEVRGEINYFGGMFRVDTVDKDTSRIIEMTMEDQNDEGLEWSKPTASMNVAEAQWEEMVKNATLNYPDEGRRELSRRDIYIEYVVGFASAQRWGPSRATQYIRELNAMINRIYYHQLGFNLNIRRITVRTSYMVANGGGCGTMLERLPGNHRRQNDVHLVHFVTAQHCGGGVAYLGGLYNGNWAYAVSGGLNGDFGRWDSMVTAHELGHNFGAWHTHEINPPADNCGNACGGGRWEVGTVMSYCHTCGGWSYVREAWHPRTSAAIAEYYRTQGWRL